MGSSDRKRKKKKENYHHILHAGISLGARF